MIDVQGYELEVLKGFEDKIQNLDFIFTEISIKEFYENNILVNELDKFMIKKGFVRTNTFLYSNIPMGDALYVNKKKLGQFITTLYTLKSKFQITNIYRFFNFFSNKDKVIYTFKKYLKELIK